MSDRFMIVGYISDEHRKDDGRICCRTFMQSTANESRTVLMQYFRKLKWEIDEKSIIWNQRENIATKKVGITVYTCMKQ